MGVFQIGLGKNEAEDAIGGVRVVLDAAEVMGSTNFDPVCGVLGYVQHSFDVSAYADGGMHTLLLKGVFNATGAGVKNFMVDDVSLGSCIP